MPVDSVEPLHLGGWDRASVWGYDEGTELWFAQLWHNTDDLSGPPRFWLGRRPPAEWACQILDAVIAVTRAHPKDVLRAMAGNSYVHLRPDHLDPPAWLPQLIGDAGDCRDAG